MMEAKVTWKAAMSFDGTAKSGFVVPLGSRPENGGESSGFSPMELVLVGLAGCTGMDVIDILRKKRQEVTSFEVRVQAERAIDHPHVFTHITVEYILGGHNLDPVAANRSVELSATKYCSVQAMLAKTAEIENKVTILETV